MDGNYVKDAYVPHKVKHASMIGTYASGVFSGIILFAIILMSSK